MPSPLASQKWKKTIEGKQRQKQQHQPTNRPTIQPTNQPPHTQNTHTHTPPLVTASKQGPYFDFDLILSNWGCTHQNTPRRTPDLTHTRHYLTVDYPNTIQPWTVWNIFLCYLCLGITGNRGHPQLEVCPRFDCVHPDQSPHLQVFTNAHPHTHTWKSVSIWLFTK